MLRIILAASVFAALAAASPSPVNASEGPWCALRNFGSDLSEDCQFHTFEECRLTVVSGFRGFCNRNPRWQAEIEPRRHRKG